MSLISGFKNRANTLWRKTKVFFSSDKYSAKENYIAANPDLSWWEGHLNAELINEIKGELSGPLADFGCNHGACSILLARQGFTVTGIDLNFQALQEARRLAKIENADVASRLNFVCSRFDALPMPDASFGGAIMFDVIEHIYEKDRPALFAEIKRVLRKGARFLVVTPYEHAYDDGVQHVAFFDEASLRQVLEGLGFRVLSIARDRRPDRHSPEGHDRLNALLELGP